MMVLYSPKIWCSGDPHLWKTARIRLRSHQVHPTALTTIQQLCSMKQKHTKYTQINTN